jgi:hypothetical protein
MSRRRKAEPKSPAEIAADRRRARAPDFEAVGLPAGAATLERNDDIEVTRASGKREGRRVQEDSARRLDAFSALKDSMEKGVNDAARRLERDLLIRADMADSGRVLVRVDEDHSRGGRTDRMIAAGDRCMAVQELLSQRDWMLLSLIVYSPFGSQFPTWRHVVEHVTKEENPNAQGAAVRAACANLAEAYEALDRVRQRAA